VCGTQWSWKSFRFPLDICLDKLRITKKTRIFAVPHEIRTVSFPNWSRKRLHLNLFLRHYSNMDIPVHLPLSRALCRFCTLQSAILRVLARRRWGGWWRVPAFTYFTTSRIWTCGTAITVELFINVNSVNDGFRNKAFKICYIGEDLCVFERVWNLLIWEEISTAAAPFIMFTKPDRLSGRLENTCSL
jgi:hypothetical protein